MRIKSYKRFSPDDLVVCEGIGVVPTDPILGSDKSGRQGMVLSVHGGNFSNIAYMGDAAPRDTAHMLLPFMAAVLVVSEMTECAKINGYYDDFIAAVAAASTETRAFIERVLRERDAR